MTTDQKTSLVLSLADRQSVLWCLRSGAGGFFIAGTVATFGVSAAAFVFLLFSLFFVTAGAIVLFRAVTSISRDSVPGRTGQRPEELGN